LLVFGPNKMPEIAKQVGKGFREFRRVQQHLKSELRDVVSEFDSPSPTPGGDPVPMLPPKDDTTAATPPAATMPLSPESQLPPADPPAAAPPPTSSEPDAPSTSA
jgi:Sec-independent protein translocase protein TatA